MSEQVHTCPTCQAPFQGQVNCPECGTDLTRIMTVIGRAFKLRCKARQALGQGHYQTARRLAQKAQGLHHTSRGQSLFYTATIGMAVRIDKNI